MLTGWWAFIAGFSSGVSLTLIVLAVVAVWWHRRTRDTEAVLEEAYRKGRRHEP